MRLPRSKRKNDVDVESCLENLDRLEAIDEARRIYRTRPKPEVLDLTDVSTTIDDSRIEQGLRAALAIELDAVSASLQIAQGAADAAARQVAQLEAELRTMPALDRRRADLQIRLGNARARHELAVIEAAELAHHRVVLS